MTQPSDTIEAAEHPRHGLPEPPPVPSDTPEMARRGQGLVEYSLMLLLIALACFATLQTVGEALQPMYQEAIDAFP